MSVIRIFHLSELSQSHCVRISDFLLYIIIHLMLFSQSPVSLAFIYNHSLLSSSFPLSTCRWLSAILGAEHSLSGYLLSVGVFSCGLHLLHLLLGHPYGLESLPQHPSTLLPQYCPHIEGRENIFIQGTYSTKLYNIKTCLGEKSRGG